MGAARHDSMPPNTLFVFETVECVGIDKVRGNGGIRKKAEHLCGMLKSVKKGSPRLLPKTIFEVNVCPFRGLFTEQ